MPLPLNKMSEKHFIAAVMRATGSTWAEISSVVNLGEVYLCNLAASPLFVAEMDRIKARLRQTITDSAFGMLEGEALASVKLLREFRDDPQVSKTVRLKAAESILDRVPKTSKMQRNLNQQSSSGLELTEDQFKAAMDFLNDDPLAREAFANAIDLVATDESSYELDQSSASASDVN